MQLFADRFVLGDDKTALDLATGERVAIAIASAGGETEQRRWALACDADEHCHHPAAARLLDYGVVGASRRFEARGIVGSLAPGVQAGAARRGDDRAPAIAIIPRPAVAAIGELFERPTGVRPRTLALWGPAGAGKHTVVASLARMARLHGFVPVAAHMLDPFAEMLRGRSLFVIDEGDERRGWSGWIGASLVSARPHVLLLVAREEPARMDGIPLDPVPAEALVRAVRLGATTDAGTIRRLAEQSGGWPGRFARLLWRRAATDDGRSTTRTLRAAEQAAIYGGEAPASASPARGGEWPAPGELAWLRRRIETGTRLIAEGRHAPGERMLRHAVGALARRRDWIHAGDGSTTLATLLIRRGRPRDAQETLRAAGDYWRRAGEEPRLIDVAVLGGTASIDLARLDEAETALGAAVAAARSLGDRARAGRALAGLARTLFWRGQYADAELTLKAIDRQGAGEAEAIAGASLEAVIAVGTRNLDLAVSRGTEALISAQRTADARLIMTAATSAAFAHLAVCDLAAVERDVAVSLAAARGCHEPLVAVRSRLVHAEALRRSGRRAAAVAILRRLSRFGASRLPPILHARCDLLRDLLAGGRAPEEIVARHVSATGLGALALYGARTSTRGASLDPIVADLIEILELCQRADDEQAVLTEVCRRIRGPLHAVATACVVAGGGVRSVIAADGGRVDLSIAERATAAGVTIAPHRCEDRLEAAAPIRYGGTTIGALVARWTIGTPNDLGSAASLLTAVAAAVAPILSVTLARPPRAPGAAMAEMIGTSAAMADVRRGVARAASAPFAVLIEGESGSGKELVARALHRCGPRRDRPFSTLNCAALPEDLVEAELFGHARGAFSGAVGERIGVFEAAHGGTLLLDEIGELSPRAQAKLLRVIQEGELRRIGENVSRRVDVRIVSATNRDLRQEVAAGRFRLDLLYRLDVVRIAVPPLRDRREDVAVLAEHFWREAAERVGSRATLAAATLAALAAYDWPGNARELQNVLAALVVRSPKRGVVPPTALGPQFAGDRLADVSTLDEARRGFEERFVRAALTRTGGHRTRAATELGVTRQGLTKLMLRLGIREG